MFLSGGSPHRLHVRRFCARDCGTPGETQGSLCIVTELLSRGSLEDVIRAGGLRTASYALILNLALQVRFHRLSVIVRIPELALVRCQRLLQYGLLRACVD